LVKLKMSAWPAKEELKDIYVLATRNDVIGIKVVIWSYAKHGICIDDQ